jgi:hypothetical protein
MARAKMIGSGWHSQSVRHSNAKKYGKAGGKIYLVAVKIPKKNDVTIYPFESKENRNRFINEVHQKYPSYKFATSEDKKRKYV